MALTASASVAPTAWVPPRMICATAIQICCWFFAAWHQMTENQILSAEIQTNLPRIYQTNFKSNFISRLFRMLARRGAKATFLLAYIARKGQEFQDDFTSKDCRNGNEA